MDMYLKDQKLCKLVVVDNQMYWMMCGIFQIRFVLLLASLPMEKTTIPALFCVEVLTDFDTVTLCHCEVYSIIGIRYYFMYCFYIVIIKINDIYDFIYLVKEQYITYFT